MPCTRQNPFRSKAQARLFFAKERRGELPRGTARRWMHETKNFAQLPERLGSYYTFGFSADTALASSQPCKLMEAGHLTRHPTTGEIFMAGEQGECVPTGWNYATVQSGQCGQFQGISVCVGDKALIGLLPTQADVAEGPPAPAPATPAAQGTFWQRYGGDILVGTITAVTGGIALYLAMRYVAKK